MVEKLLTWLKGIPTRLVNWWEKFTVRQKTAIISMTAIVLAAFIILIVVLSKPTYVTIFTAESAKEAQSVLDLLDGSDIPYETSEDGLVIKINKRDYTTANLLLGSNDIYADSYGIDNVTDGGFSTTESDKQKRYVVYLENLMKETLEAYNFVKEATVQLNIPEDDGTLIAKNTEKSASVLLDLSDECTSDTAAAMARFVATALGNKTTENITINDTEGHMLFSGTDESSTYGSASSQYALTEQVSNMMKNDVKQVLIATNEFSNIEVAAKVVLDNAYTEYSDHLYWPDEGKDQGVLASKDTYNSQSNGGVNGVPGTDSNTETTYVYEDNEYSNQTVTEESDKYLPNESTTLKQIPAGAIKYEDCSITITALTYDVQHEEDIKSQGLLDGTTWEEYKHANKERIKDTVDDDLYSAVATATGIAVNNITIIHYIEPFFIDKEGLNLESSDILVIVMIALIVGLLVFVLIRSMKSAKVDEEEEEISIEDILQSTPPEELDEIGVEDKSEARKIVEKFVDDNPEAAANLLRNWLSEDWS